MLAQNLPHDGHGKTGQVFRGEGINGSVLAHLQQLKHRFDHTFPVRLLLVQGVSVLPVPDRCATRELASRSTV